MGVKITSLDNPQIKQAIQLQDRRHRKESKLFLIEGYRELKRAFESGVTLHKLFICPELFLGVNEPDLIRAIEESGTAVLICSEKVFAKLSYRDRPDGLLGVAVQMATTLGVLGARMKKPPLLIIAEGIEKPGNLGSIMRSADGVGADGVIVCDPCTDIYNPNVVRASVGTLFTLPIVEAEGGETFTWLEQHQIKIVATSPQAKVDYTETDLRGRLPLLWALNSWEFQKCG